MNYRRLYSRVEPSKLLHLVVTPESSGESFTRVDVVDPHEFIQCAVISMPAEHTFPPHAHVYREEHTLNFIAQESWVVIRGLVIADLYDIDDQLLESVELYPGMASISLGGGHTYTSKVDGTLVYEYKTGPYHGISMDKRQI